jgi:hypothetical protein
MRALFTACLAVFSSIAVPAAVLAHHGWSSYDAGKITKISGPALSVKWENPHGEITMNHDGGAWVIALAPTARMESRGLSRDALTQGKNVTVDAYPRSDGTKEMRAERIIVDGKTIELR